MIKTDTLKNKRKYFNSYEYDRICKLTHTDIIGAKEAFEDYLIRYKEDLSAYSKYANILLSLGELDKAESILDLIDYKMYKAQHYKEDDEKTKGFRTYLIHLRAKLYVYQNKIEEALELMHTKKEAFKDTKSFIYFYLRSLIEDVDKTNRDKNAYMYRQIIEYKEEDFIDHIKKHEADFNENDKEISPVYFAPDFPLETAIEEVKKNLKRENAINSGFVSNIYTFKYDACGRESDKIADYFHAVTLRDTKNLISMYPQLVVDTRNYVDLNYLKDKEETPKVKRISQIDKFNRRYNMNK